MELAGKERLVQNLTWQAAIRSDLGVAEALMAGEEPDGVYGLGDARIVDTFFCWLEELGVLDELRALPTVGVQREVIPSEMYVLIYFLRCIARIPSQDSLPELLFSDTALMQRLGFNAHQLEFGITQRSAARRQGPRRNLPVDPEAVSKNVVKLNLEAVRTFIHKVLCRIWTTLPKVPKRVLGAIDGSLLDVGPTAKGAKTTVRNKQIRTRDGLRTVDVAMTGFTMVWLWCPENGLPLAVAFGTAEVDERPFVAGLLKQAREVLGERGVLDTIVIDKGFINGPGLWEIAAEGIRFVIPARRDMNVYEDARRRALFLDSDKPIYAKTRTLERKVRGDPGTPLRTITETMDVVGVEGCPFETYAPASEIGTNGHRNQYKKNFVPNTINAVVLTRQDGRENPDFALLTNGPVNQPFATFDDYDERSRIENQGHRDLKQSWFLEHPVQRTAAATELHVLFVVLSYALTGGYRHWVEDQARQEDAGKPTTLGQFIRKLAAENHDKIIVFVGEQYGIYYTSEFTMLLGRRVKRPNPKGAATLEDLMVRLRASPGQG